MDNFELLNGENLDYYEILVEPRQAEYARTLMSPGIINIRQCLAGEESEESHNCRMDEAGK